jgi:aminoglycoside phosphotransferase (APT) family kinase protein
VRLHDGETEISTGIVRRLLAEQFPELAGLAVREVRSTGTVNRIFRIGDDLYARLPRIEKWAADLELEWRSAARLASRLSLMIPEPVAKGSPAAAYPLPWAIYRWIDGEPYADELVEDEEGAARDLAAFVASLRAVPLGPGVPPGGRRPLRALDEGIRGKIDGLRFEMDVGAAFAVWSDALAAPEWDGTPVWVHADLLRPNVLVNHGTVTAVIDFGMAGAGDPAADVIAAWTVFGGAGRAVYRDALGVDDGTWRRARGYALFQVTGIAYYSQTNPGFAALARRTVREVLAEFSENT